MTYISSDFIHKVVMAVAMNLSFGGLGQVSAWSLYSVM